MLHIHSREQQLAKLRADRQRDLASERVIVDFAVANDILPVGADRLFDHPGQYPGWHRVIADLIRNISVVVHSMLSGFAVIGGALATRAGDGLLLHELELILDASDRTSLICRICGALRGRQPMSVARMTCDICTTVDLLMGNDPEAASARSWHLTI